MATRRSTVEVVNVRNDTGFWKTKSTTPNNVEKFVFLLKKNFFSVVVSELPWGSNKIILNSNIDFCILPAKFSAQTMLLELFNVFEKKLNQVNNDDPFVG